MIAILCAHDRSNYFKMSSDLDIYTKCRDAYSFDLDIPVIAHPPCAQWSRMRAFAHTDLYEKDLGPFCIEKVRANGGIVEHPAGTRLFDFMGVCRSELFSVDQSWWGFPARKRTYLYFVGCSPLSYPLSFSVPPLTVCQMSYSKRALTPLSFNQYLVDCVLHSDL